MSNDGIIKDVIEWTRLIVWVVFLLGILKAWHPEIYGFIKGLNQWEAHKEELDENLQEQPSEQPPQPSMPSPEAPNQETAPTVPVVRDL
ncbi:MAG: hypothetical protein AAGA75_11700 [Cyanobacteria bacterium P01_E01_bin.6]